MTIYVDVIVFEVIFVAWLTFSARGKGLLFQLNMKLLKWYTGFTKFRTVDLDNKKVQSVTFRDGSRYVIVRDTNGHILEEYPTGRLASIYDRQRRGLLYLIR